jgi:tRNA(adenine34) deaminase
MPLQPTDDEFMRAALEEARKAYGKGEVPVGCVVTRAGAIIGRGHNLRETSRDPIAHAEILAIAEAAKALGQWRLEDCDLFVTLEPCPMCAGAIVNARMRRVVFGAADPKAGACGTLFNVIQDSRLNHRAEPVAGVLAEEASGLLKRFFRECRDGTSQARPSEDRSEDRRKAQ